MTLPAPQDPSKGCARASPRFQALVIDRIPERRAEICRELEKAPDIGVRGAVSDAGLGIVSAVRHAPDCVLLGWDGTTAVSADIASILCHARDSLKVVIVTTSEEESALVRSRLYHACTSLSVSDLARCLPGLLAREQSAA